MTDPRTSDQAGQVPARHSAAPPITGVCPHWRECPDCRAFITTLRDAAQDAEERGYQRALTEAPEFRDYRRQRDRHWKRVASERTRAAWLRRRPFAPPPIPAGLPVTDDDRAAWDTAMERHERARAAWQAERPGPGRKRTGVQDAHIAELYAAWRELRERGVARPSHRQTIAHLHRGEDAEAIERHYETSRARLRSTKTRWSTLTRRWIAEGTAEGGKK